MLILHSLISNFQYEPNIFIIRVRTIKYRIEFCWTLSVDSSIDYTQKYLPNAFGTQKYVSGIEQNFTDEL